MMPVSGMSQAATLLQLYALAAARNVDSARIAAEVAAQQEALASAQQATADALSSGTSLDVLA